MNGGWKNPPAEREYEAANTYAREPMDFINLDRRLAEERRKLRARMDEMKLLEAKKERTKAIVMLVLALLGAGIWFLAAYGAGHLLGWW